MNVTECIYADYMGFKLKVGGGTCVTEGSVNVALG